MSATINILSDDAHKEDPLSKVRPSIDYVNNDLTHSLKHAIELERNQIGIRKQEKVEQ